MSPITLEVRFDFVSSNSWMLSSDLEAPTVLMEIQKKIHLWLIRWIEVCKISKWDGNWEDIYDLEP